MELSSQLFYILSTVLVIFSLAVILSNNPIHSALYLALTMISLAFVFFLMKAFFLAAVQLIVYAGAVMVLFVMVIMLFDLEKEKNVFAKGPFTGFIKIASAGWLCGLIAGAVYMSTEMISTSSGIDASKFANLKTLGAHLFSKYLFAFDAIGILLLLVAIGAVAISKMKGGTHA